MAAVIPKRRSFAGDGDAQSVQEKLKLQEIGEKTPENTDEERFRVFQQCFDEVIERLPACGPLLAQVKHEYDGVISTLARKSHDATALAHKLCVKATEMDTIRNYYLRLQELEAKLASTETDNIRMKNEMERMQNERDTALEERESKLKQLKQQKPQMTSSRRHALRLSLEEATNIACLEKEFQKSKKKLQEAKEVTKRKYISAQRKQTLQSHLKAKEDLRKELSAQNQALHQLLRRLKGAIEAAKVYGSFMRAQQSNQCQTDVADYILATIGDLKTDEMEGLSDEELDDPMKEIEAKMILDCFEKFNELFENECYEEAALHAATSPKGILRTSETMQKFKNSAKHVPGKKPPLLSYCEALLCTAAAYRPLPPLEALECARCMLEQGEVSKLSQWIAQKVLPLSIELGTFIYQCCKCDLRCTCKCGCKDMAFIIFKDCNAPQQAALCLVQQGRFISFLAFAHREGFTSQDYVSILYTFPSLELARHLVMPPSPHSQHVTVFEAMYLLLESEQSQESLLLFEDFLKAKRLTQLQAVLNDNRTTWEVWQSLAASLQRTTFSDTVLELLSSLTVKISLNRAVEYMLQDCAVADTRMETQHSICSNEASEEMGSESRLSSVPSGSGSASGYSSSSEKSGYSSSENEESSDIDCEV